MFAVIVPASAGSCGTSWQWCGEETHRRRAEFAATLANRNPIRPQSYARNRSTHHRQGLETARTVSHRLLFRRLSRPRQCRLCRADDEPGPWPVADGVRLRSRDLLPRLFLLLT